MGRTVRFAGWLVLLASVGAAACGRGAPAGPTGPPSEQARAYLDELIGLMQGHSINRLTIDWSAFRTKVFARAAGAQSIPDTYPAIQVALDALGDGHSVYYASTGTVFEAVMADRTKTAYGYSIQPDETVTTDRVVERAVAWLRTGT